MQNKFTSIENNLMYLFKRSIQKKFINDPIQQICRDMKQVEHSNWKVTFDIKRRLNNGKIFQNQKVLFSQLVPKKSMGKKYMQEPNIFKQKFQQPKKSHREIVMSEQFIRSSKLYRLLKDKMDRCDSMYMKQVNTLQQQKMKLVEDIKQLKTQNYHQKLQLWELKNKLMDLKTLYHQQQEESKRLCEQNYDEYQGQMEQEQTQFEDEQGQNEQQKATNQENHEYTTQQHEFNHNTYINNFISSSSSQKKITNMVQDKTHLSEILQELINLKAERNSIQKSFNQTQNEIPLQSNQNLFQQNQSNNISELSHHNK